MSTPEKDHTSKIVQPAIPSPTHGPGGSFSVEAKIFIPDTTPAAVLAVIRDTSTWERWNPHTPFFRFSSSPSSPGADSDPGSDLIPPGKEGWLNLGSRGAMSVFMSGDGLAPGARDKKTRQQVMVVTILEPLSSSSPSPTSPGEGQKRKGLRIAWKSEGYPHWQLHTERVTDLLEVDDGEGRRGTEYVCWESFGGLIAPVVRLAVGSQLRERFGEYAVGLRRYCIDSQEKDGGVVGE
ncbi:uncharacterized protein RAG0_00621 [Rhynchosporium agropyri]|uniref:Coenzyme Q-binding protein COQ10 START domain-containing protein n=1 Tax=Rhynchosporium agropyri TaxID=914238 RepID=A0A1E1JTR4_9HELO|nr:uncharacterized protein RAG0_00621 [Rhynchosporium agropyri]